MALQAKQTIQQRLLLAPNVTLALEILRMQTMDLQAFLYEQAENNPLLELEENPPDETETLPEPAEAPAEAPEGAGGLDEEWLDHWRDSGEAEEEDDAGRREDPRLTRSQTLHESLQVQLGCLPLAPAQRRIAQALLAHLRDDGYLEGTLEELAAALRMTAAAVEDVLRLLQRCEPPGVGARDLRECLMLQLEHRDARETLAYRIVRDHFEPFVRRQLAAVARGARVALPEVERAVQELKRLNPKPGLVFAAELSPAIVPDLIIHRREQHYDVEVNDEDVPRVHISRAYHRMLRDPRTPEEARAFLLRKFRQASWVIRAIDERNATLLAIARCLLSLQRDFVHQGPQALKPLTQAQVAQLIGRHASTVSRAISGKTIDTPYGVFRLEEFFASGVPQGPEAGDVSDTHIKSEIERLIQEEDRQAPLSDEALVRRLAQRKISVARRTIAKYRTSLHILPAHLRRRRL
jgi:RNA polymerase sigma-54 factor